MDNTDRTDYNQSSIIEALILLWKNRFFIIVFNLVIILGTTIYTLVVDEVFEVSTVLKLAEANEENLANPPSTFRGIALPTSESPMLIELKLTLESRAFKHAIIEKYKNDEILFGDILEDVNPQEDYEKFRFKAMEYLEKRLRYDYDTNSDLLTVILRLEDKYYAEKLLSDIVTIMKTHVRKRNDELLVQYIKEYENILQSSENLIIKDDIKQMLLKKIKKTMMLTSNFYTVLDPPVAPYKKWFPKRSLIIIIATIMSVCFSLALVFVYDFYKKFTKKISKYVVN